MKFIAYVTKCVPVEVEVDDKWKPMEDYGNHVDETTEEENRYFDANIEDFLTDIENKLKKMDEDFSFDNLCAVWTMEDNYITEL
jgi:hypothetical protein|nr:MAG TPA_asm: hypothetical protein [Caudoviricetes sp.]